MSQRVLVLAVAVIRWVASAKVGFSGAGNFVGLKFVLQCMWTHCGAY